MEALGARSSSETRPFGPKTGSIMAPQRFSISYTSALRLAEWQLLVRGSGRCFFCNYVDLEDKIGNISTSTCQKDLFLNVKRPSRRLCVCY